MPNHDVVPGSDNGVVLTPAEQRRRRARSVAIALALAALVLMFYVVTIVKIGSNVATAPM
jgi:threonine/homoserine/homoserine lactone efflux protein